MIFSACGLGVGRTFRLGVLVVLIGGILTVPRVYGESVPYRIQGQAWSEFGRIMQVSNTLGTPSGNIAEVDLEGDWMQAQGAQFTAVAELGPNFDGAFGFGVKKVSHSLANGSYPFFAISLFQNYISQARLTYFQGERAKPWFSVTAGNFVQIYNPDVKNLGSYLFRGPVYPGVLMSGFSEAGTDSSRSNIMGLRFHHAMGGFSHDLVLKNEVELPPTLDWSLGYVAKYSVGAFEIGGGVNFYRLFAYRSALETPGKLDPSLLAFNLTPYVDIDTTGGTPDTTFLTHQGTKVVGFFSLDFKKLLGLNPVGDDLKLYGEAGVIGLKNYGTIYSKISERIPVMVGFNLPTFGFLDHLSLEVEHYGAKYRPDLAGLGNLEITADWTIERRPIPSPKPRTYQDYSIDPVSGIWVRPAGDTVYVFGTAMDVENMTKDDLKWSLFVDKTVSKRVRFSAQIASDHYRPRSISTGFITADGGTAEALSDVKDWYFMFRMGYFF